ncbi:hypothetical protein LTR72_003423 [Exophiala xenobiotica]|nr:hypothetical protein LTR72_003423 [Exophiala xenobiotica]KAK5298340.1 hypothetical protein LTR14_002191 [Exophiala xenobiotica]
MAAPQLVPTHSQWAAMYSEIERLYVRERRKLRYIMQYMEREHGFKATEQMYKKRFAKWGFQKNSKRSAVIVPTLTKKDECRKEASRKPGRPRELGLVLTAIPRLGQHDGLMLMFLTSVRICSVAFFESVQSRGGFLESLQQRPPTDEQLPERTEKINFTFKLATDLLDRGHGRLAGRMVRKAFLLVEDMLTLEGPVLLWNLLEIMHHMVTLRHMQLFQMLLAHLLALIEGRIPNSHPVPTMLHGLRGLVTSLTSTVSIPRSSLPTSSSSSSLSSSSSSTTSSSPYASIDGGGTATTTGPWLLSRALSSLLERAWVLNAEILFKHLNPRLLPLYCRLHLNACSIAPPAGIISTANQWFSQIGAQQMSRAGAEGLHTEDVSGIVSVEEDRTLQGLLAPRLDASPPQDYEMLRASSAAALWKHGNSVLAQGAGFHGDTTILMRILAGLLTDAILEEPHTPNTSSVTTKVSRVQAGKVACAIRTLMDLSPEHGGDDDGDGDGDGRGPLSDAVERIRSVVALREYAHAETDPQVVREMWLLEDALVAAGEYGEAEEVGQDAFCRLEKYIQDIPVDSA